MTREKMLCVFKQVLDKHLKVGKVDLDRLRITEKVVTEAQDGDKPLSEAILDGCFPRADTKLEYVHYSTFGTLEGVMATGQWRLYWVFKRLQEDEYQTFCRDHNLDGYLAVDPHTKRPYFEDMCRDLFYTSLTRLPSVNEADMWETFGDHGRGVRLVFRVQPVLNRSEFRPVRYQNALLKTLIQELRAASESQLHRPLVIMGISRIGGFYLPMGYNIEEETRLLIKRFNDPELAANPWAVVQKDGTHEYLPLPLNQDNEFCRVDLVRVDAGPRRSQQDVDKELRKSPRFAHLARPQNDVEALTAEEHVMAQRRAYDIALERGGGKLPPYNQEASTGDFWRAAGEIVTQRPLK